MAPVCLPAVTAAKDTACYYPMSKQRCQWEFSLYLDNNMFRSFATNMLNMCSSKHAHLLSQLRKREVKDFVSSLTIIGKNRNHTKKWERRCYIMMNSKSWIDQLKCTIDTALTWCMCTIAADPIYSKEYAQGRIQDIEKREDNLATQVKIAH